MEISEESKAKEELENALNLKILDSILDDDENQFSELIAENIQDPSESNKTFNITNFKFPNILKGNLSYASLCAFFNAEKCFEVLSLFHPGGTASEEMKKVDDFKRSPIHFACIGGSLKILRELDQSMFDLNARDFSGYLPSHYAAMSGNFDVIKYLWTKGADLTSPSYENNTTPLQVACFYGNLDIVTFLCETVIQNQIEPTGNGSSNFLRNFLSVGRQPTPLHYACRGGQDNVVNYFLSKPELINLQINSLDKNSRNPLLCACYNGSLSCVKALLNGAAGKIKLDMKGRKHLPLVDAASGGYLDVVNFLIQQKKIIIQQETSDGMSALHAAVLNDHLEVVKLLVRNGALNYLSKDKIGHIFFSAIHIESMKLISYLDSVIQIPYTEKYQVEQATRRTNFYYRRAVAENESKNLSYGDFYMQQACIFENKEIIQFLLDKKCSFDFLNISKFATNKNFPFIEYLIEKGFDPSCSKNPDAWPPIVNYINIGKIQLIEKFISYGAILNEEIILKYFCLNSALKAHKDDVFLFLMNYVLELTSEYATKLLSLIFNQFYVRFQNRLSNKCLDMIEILLKKSPRINFNLTFNDFNFTFISYAAENRDLNLLKLLDKYGADFRDCKLHFEPMTKAECIPIYMFLKENGCTFDRSINNPSSYGYPRIADSCPLQKIFSTFIAIRGKNPDVILFMLDYTKPKDIINIKYAGSNLINLFMDQNCSAGIVKVYTLVKGIIYPLHVSVQVFNMWVLSANNATLSNLLFNSGLKVVKGDDNENDGSSNDDDDSSDII